MIRINRLLFIILGLLWLSTTFAQTGQQNHCYDPNIRTIRIYREGNVQSEPVYELGSRERLILDFDDLGEELRRFKYTIVHCGSDWTPTTDLTPFEYINGFNEENIDEYVYSFNTTIPFIHYKTTFPTDDLAPKLSGNYLLKVYDDEPSNLIFTLRMMVSEASPLLVTGYAVRADNPAINNTHQQLDFVVRLNGLPVNDIGQELKVVIRQNGRWDNVLTVSRPRIARGNELDYRYDDNLVFTGGNQFRNFDIRSLVYQSERIGAIRYDNANHVYLLPDPPRTYKPYINEEDLNGKFFIRNDDHANDMDREADYAWVHFELPYPVMLTSGGFHVAGDMTLWQLDESTKMIFNRERKVYELALLLKQGYYNYQYVLSAPSQKVADEALIEGNHWETENRYTVLIYFKPAGELYERLVSVNFLDLNRTGR